MKIAQIFLVGSKVLRCVGAATSATVVNGEFTIPILIDRFGVSSRSLRVRAGGQQRLRLCLWGRQIPWHCARPLGCRTIVAER